MLNESVIRRFWSHVRRGSRCWKWTASKYRNGYGQFVIRGEKRTPAHRTAFRIACGKIPDGMCVLHHCDNRACVRPSHLFLGTKLDNARDAKRKHRTAWGTRSGSAKLNRVKILRIRRLFSQGKTQCELARRFGVTQTCISKITRAANWHHLEISPIPSNGRHARGERCPCAKMTTKGVLLMRSMAERGQKNTHLARLFGVSSVLVGLIVRRKIWKWL